MYINYGRDTYIIVVDNYIFFTSFSSNYTKYSIYIYARAYCVYYSVYSYSVNAMTPEYRLVE